MTCNNRLLFEVKQGEDRPFTFTIYEGDNPLDLTGYSIDFEVRPMANVNIEPLFTKNINELEDVDGYINNPIGGEFTIQIYRGDIDKLPPMDCYVSIYLVDNGTRTCISGDGNNFAIIRICGC